MLTILTFSPLIGVLLLLLVPKDRLPIIRGIGVAATLIPLIIALFSYGSSTTELHKWISIPLNLEAIGQIPGWTFEIQYHMSLDGISLPLVLMTTVVAAMAAIASFTIKNRAKTYYILFLLLEIGMLGVFMARDLFLFFAFFEWTLVPTFFMIGIWGLANREKALLSS